MSKLSHKCIANMLKRHNEPVFPDFYIIENYDDSYK